MEAKSEEKRKPENLPESGNEEFWGDGEQYSKPVEEVRPVMEHEWRQKGNMAICQTCPMEHGVFLDNRHEVRDGKIVKKRP